MHSAMDSYAMGASERYLGLLNEHRDALRQVMLRRRVDARGRNILRQQLLTRSQEFRETEIAMLTMALSEWLETARSKVMSDLGLTSAGAEVVPVQDYQDKLIEFASTELTSQIQRDMAQALRHLEEFSLEVFMHRQRGVTEDEAIANAVINGRARHQFFFSDRSGRRHPSQKFIRTLMRHTLLVGFVEVYALHAAAFGADHMLVEHPDKEATHAGMKVGITRENGLPLVSDLKDEVFHPNSNASLKAYF